jgi:hypothetical protein
MHQSLLLRAGVDINTIRAWLGHVSLDTTHVYAEVDMEMKAKAGPGRYFRPTNPAAAANATVADNVPDNYTAAVAIWGPLQRRRFDETSTRAPG